MNGGHTLYSYVHDPNGWVDVFGLAKKGGELGKPLPDNEKVYRLGNEVGLSKGDRTLETPGNSVIRANSEKEAGGIMRDAFSDKDKFSVIHDKLDNQGFSVATAKDIRAVGYDVVENKTGNLGDAHARIIHPDGEKAFDENIDKLQEAFSKESGCDE